MKFLMSVLLIGVIGCSSTGKNDSNPYGSIDIDLKSFKKKHKVGKTIFFKTSGTTKTDDEMSYYSSMLQKSFEMAGFQYVSDEKSADYRIKAEFDREKPITGQPILGNLTPYRHMVDIKAYQKDKLVWQVSVVGPSEDKDILKIFPALLAVAYTHYNKNSNGVEQYHVDWDDPDIQKIRDAE